jgi:hypothetical protein
VTGHGGISWASGNFNGTQEFLVDEEIVKEKMPDAGEGEAD